MSKLEKNFTIFACGFFVCSAITGRYLDCIPMAAFSGLFAAMTWLTSLADGGEK